MRSEPGRLLGRGVEDDKGPIAAAIYSMRRCVTGACRPVAASNSSSLGDRGVGLDTVPRVPGPVGAAAAQYRPRCGVPRRHRGARIGDGRVTLPPESEPPHRPPDDDDARLVSLQGGRFPSQIPAEADAVVTGAGPDLGRRSWATSTGSAGVAFDLETTRDSLHIHARVSSRALVHAVGGPQTPSHTSRRFWAPEGGRRRRPPRWCASSTISSAPGHYAERFGAVAYAHDFMGPLTSR